jgi:hypothetical protein
MTSAITRDPPRSEPAARAVLWHDVKSSHFSTKMSDLAAVESSPMNLLDRDKLTDEQWSVLRAAPQLVLLAVSASGGSRLDTILERSAGRRAIENGRNNDHPVIREIAEPAQIEAAEHTVAASAYDEHGVLLEADQLLALAENNVRAAADLLRRTGSELDMYAYREFIVGIARAVAEAAREGDFLGLGGHRVSDAERAVIAAVSQALST